jgi:hypothetical protein
MAYGRNFEGDLRDTIVDTFGERLTARELWALVRLVKHCRRFCRSNNALNPCLQRLFPYARFKQVPKMDPRTGQTYSGLQITVREETVEDGENDSAEAA